MSFLLKIILFWNRIAGVWVGWGLGKTCLLAPTSKGALSKSCLGASWNVGAKVFGKKSYLDPGISEVTDKLKPEVAGTAIVGSMQNNLFQLKPQAIKPRCAWGGLVRSPEGEQFPWPLRLVLLGLEWLRRLPWVCWDGIRGLGDTGLLDTVGHRSYALR